MLKSAATALMGITFGLLGTAELAISPSDAQQLQPQRSICRPLVPEWTRCVNGRMQRCKTVVHRVPNVASGCVWEYHCRPMDRGCLARPS